MKKRYYYFRLSFMRKYSATTITYVDGSVSVDEGNPPFFPLMPLMRWAMEQYKDVANVKTIEIVSHFEICEQDFKDFNELRKSQGYQDFSNIK